MGRYALLASGRLDNIPLIRRGMDRIARRNPMHENTHVEYFRIGQIEAAWIIPDGVDRKKVAYYLHGGGYHMGSINSHKALIARIAHKTGVSAMAINYRMAPEHPFPAALHDATHAYEWLLENDFNAKDIIIAGESAGGGLTFSTMVSLRDRKMPLPKAAVCLSPWTDLAATGDSLIDCVDKDPMLDVKELRKWAKRYAGDYPTDHPLVSPLYADLSGLPPILIQVGTDEIIMDDSTRIAERAKAAGVDVSLEVWEEMSHAWQFFFAYIPEAKDAVDNVVRFMKRQWER